MASGESLHHQLQHHLDSQQWEPARDVAYQLLENSPESSWIHTTLGKVFYKLGNLSHAESHLKHAIYHQDNHVEAYIYLGKVYLKMKRMGSADDHCNKALAHDSTNLQAWSLAFQIKLAYKDLEGARDCYATLERLGADICILRELKFALLRHPAHKQPFDFEVEITSCKEHLATFPQHTFTHVQLAYLYNRFTNESDLAEKHILIALESNPHDPLFQETSILIQRKKNLLIRMLTAPVISITRPEQIGINEVAAVGLVTLSGILFTILGSQNPWMIRAGIFALITLYFCSYTGNLAFQYLAYTERFHQLGKTSLFRDPNRQIHCLPFKKRFLLTAGITITAWILLGAFLYFLTR